ncbi:EVE domain-containing protein [Alphaproteobacteria bacterium]|jgi:predicted RNA-binding protein with PUA-like domain|nr:EVE domain-containing protein [Alphaproteobacteria bacterium]
MVYWLVKTKPITWPWNKKGRFGMVGVKAVKPMKKYEALSDVKIEPRLSDLALVQPSRLSAAPISNEEWKVIISMG